MTTIMEKFEEIQEKANRLRVEMVDMGMDTVELPPRPYTKSKELFMDEQIARAEEDEKKRSEEDFNPKDI